MWAKVGEKEFFNKVNTQEYGSYAMRVKKEKGAGVHRTSLFRASCPAFILKVYARGHIHRRSVRNYCKHFLKVGMKKDAISPSYSPDKSIESEPLAHV